MSLKMGIDWVDNPRPRSEAPEARIALERKYRERQRQRETVYRAGCQDAARVLASHPSYKADPFAYDRALNLMVRHILNPQDVLDAKGAISV